jgi:tetratricopeptide (TPR) repeat protein
MAKPGRNDRCPCGSGKKYKSCCLTTDEVAEREQLANAQAGRDERAAEKRQCLRQLKDEVADHFRMAEEADAYEDELDAASNAVVDLVKAGKFDEAEAAARDLLVRFPDVHDGWDRLGMVHEARGNGREAADCYRKVIAFIHQHPDGFDANITDDFAKLVARLDPPATR